MRDSGKVNLLGRNHSEFVLVCLSFLLPQSMSSESFSSVPKDVIVAGINMYLPIRHVQMAGLKFPPG